MNKKIIKILISLCFANYAFANNGGIITEFNPQKQIQEIRNQFLIQRANQELSSDLDYMNKLESCSQQGRYYIPSSGLAKPDGCVDVLAIVAAKLKNPTYFNTLASAEQGDLGYTTNNYANTKAGQGVILADILCAENNPSTRALRLEDIKYNSNIPNVGNVFVFEAIKDSNDTIHKILTKQDEIIAVPGNVTNLDCSGYTSTDSSYLYPILDTSSMKLKLANCNASSKIMCVSK